MQLLIDKKIPNDASFSDIEKIYNKNKNKLPVSFKNYYDYIFKGKDRYYLTDSYERYLNEMYMVGNDDEQGNKSGKISMIILSFIMVVIAIIGYFVFKLSR